MASASWWSSLRVGLLFGALGVAMASACGRSTIDAGDVLGAGGSPVGPSSSSSSSGPGGHPNPCGDGVCGAGENCMNCVPDCGFCQGCGDGVCAGDESCASCPQDCGICKTCGDG